MREVYVVTTSFPGPEGCEFVEVEDAEGNGVRVEWSDYPGSTLKRLGPFLLPDPPAQMTIVVEDETYEPIVERKRGESEADYGSRKARAEAARLDAAKPVGDRDVALDRATAVWGSLNNYPQGESNG